MDYNILDFSNWEDDGKFGDTFNKLIDGLELFHKKMGHHRTRTSKEAQVRRFVTDDHCQR